MKFLGKHEVTVDSKGRFLMPKALREKLPEDQRTEFVLSHSFDNAKCIRLYTAAQFQAEYEANLELDDLMPEVATFLRLIYAEAIPVSLDSADRLLIDRGLMEAAGITKDVVIVPSGKKMELWDRDSYRAYVAEHKHELPSLSRQMATNPEFKIKK